jgi:hypothetical protein
MGYSSPDGDKGPNKVETRFFFGRNSIFEPRVFRMKITPNDLHREFKLTYNNSYLTVDPSGNEAFKRIFSVDFDPAAELQITSIPGKGMINYNFGNSNSVATKILFSAIGGFLSNIVQSFTIDTLPEYMSFDLTVLGERSFKYESDEIYAVKYLMDSVQGGNLVKLELNNLPKKMDVEWGLLANLFERTASGFIDLNMSDELGEASISLFGNKKPFIKVEDFPNKLRLDGFVDVPNLKGHLSAIRSSGPKMTISVPISFDKWDIIGNLVINDGYGLASFDLPSGNSNYTSIGLDTDNNALFGFDLSVINTETDIQLLYVGVGAIATNDLYISFGGDENIISNFEWSGKITQLVDLIISVDFQGAVFDISSSWTLGESGSFQISLNKEVDVTFVDIETDQLKLYGHISLNNGRFVKFDWELDSIGHFLVFTNGPVGDELFLEIGYGSKQNNEYQYGFKIEALDFLDLTRTIMWDTEHGIIPRIWFLGDEGFPNNWDVWLLWNYEWYEVK